MLTERTVWLAATAVTIVLLVVMIFQPQPARPLDATYLDFGGANGGRCGSWELRVEGGQLSAKLDSLVTSFDADANVRR